MCGICGIANLAGGPAPDPVLVRRMMGRLRHRGPDASGYYRDPLVALGHTRLSIIDVAGGAQPMANEDETLWITYNGEVFNYVELREELAAAGHRFRTKSDTEVILHAWEEWGEECFSRLNGQWALALWDTRRRELILSRDRNGIRPLYYVRSGGRLLFGSEVKALFADPGVERRPDPAGLKEVFTFWSPIAERTVFDGVRQLRPGCTLTVRAGLPGDELRQRPYWTPSFAEDEESRSEADYADELRERLRDASRLRFTRTDVPVGAYLSGGLDSSITSAVINAWTDAPLSTFSVRFEDAEFDETTFQELMAKRLGTHHQGVVVTRRAIGEVFPDVISHVERPILRSAPAPLFLLSRLVRDAGYKVVVTGEGADEVLAGYDIFREGKVREFVARDPDSTVRREIITRLYPWLHRSPAQAPAFAKAFFGRNLHAADRAISHRPRWDAAAGVGAMLAPELRAAAEGVDVTDDLLARMPAESSQWDSLGRSQWLEMVTLLEGYILSAQGDRMLMAHSVEGRFPFLDERLVDFAGRMPARYKLMGLDEKHILKKAFADLVPPEILARPKQPYRAPDAASFVGEHEPEWVAELLSPASVEQAGLFNPIAVEKLLAKARRRAEGDGPGTGMGNTDNMRLVGVLSGMLWHHQMIAGRADSSDEAVPEPITIIDRTGAAYGIRTATD